MVAVGVLVLLAHADMPNKLLMDVLHAWHWAKAQGEARAPACSHDRVPSSSCAHIIWLLDCATRVTYALWTTRAGVSVLFEKSRVASAGTRALGTSRLVT